jgi:hypothetical protein
LHGGGVLPGRQGRGALLCFPGEVMPNLTEYGDVLDDLPRSGEQSARPLSSGPLC